MTASTRRSATRSRFRHPGISRPDRPAAAQQGAVGGQGYRPAAPPGDGQGRLPAVRPARRQMALGVFSGEISPANYNRRLERPPAAISGHRSAGRSAASRISIRAPNITCRRASPTRAISSPGSSSSSSTRPPASRPAGPGPLHRCSFYGNKEVGRRLNAMLAMGASKPWPDALEAFTGTREMSGEAMLEYFRPLMRLAAAAEPGPPVRLAGLIAAALAAGLAVAAPAAGSLVRRRRSSRPARSC